MVGQVGILVFSCLLAGGIAGVYVSWGTAIPPVLGRER